MHVARPALALRAGSVRTGAGHGSRSRSAPSASVPPGIGVVEGNEIPYTPAALAQKKKNQENWLTSDPEIKCYLPGVPRATYMPYPVPDLPEPEGVLHRLRVRGRDAQHLPEGSRSRAGRLVDGAVGRTLGRRHASSSTSPASTIRRGSIAPGNFHSDALHVVERYTRTSPDVISYEATIEDPKVFTRPWKMSMPLYRRAEKNAQLMDFKCVEFVEELMYGQWRKKPLSQ